MPNFFHLVSCSVPGFLVTIHQNTAFMTRNLYEITGYSMWYLRNIFSCLHSTSWSSAKFYLTIHNWIKKWNVFLMKNLCQHFLDDWRDLMMQFWEAILINIKWKRYQSLKKTKQQTHAFKSSGISINKKIDSLDYVLAILR